MRKILEENGIKVAEECFNANAFKMDEGVKDARDFAKSMIEKYYDI